MHKQQVKMLKAIMALEFTAIELNLYLDTHPGDQKALMDYNMVSQQLRAAKKQYESQFGPLANFGEDPSKYPWQWIEEPWPWQIEY